MSRFNDEGLTITTFEDYLRERGRSEHTIRAYSGDAGEFRIFLNGRAPTFDLFEDWTRECLNHGKLSPRSAQRKIAGAKVWLAFGARHGDSAAEATLERIRLLASGGYRVGPAVRQRDEAAVSEVTEAEYREAMGRAGPEGRALLSLLWQTGARVSEVVGDPLAGIPALTVEGGRSLVEQGHVQTWGKGGRRRILVLSTAGREDLRMWVEARAAAIGRTEGSGPVAAACLFDMTTSTVRRHLKALLAELRPHRFRHALRARLRRAGVSDEVIHALLGHGPRDTTEGYGRVSLEEMLQAVEALI